ncbi:hypothetical protein [Bosea thiooxidans]
MLRTCLLVAVSVMALTTSPQAGSQSSNTSSNSSSNNGVVRERIVDRYCEDGYCERRIQRRVYREDWRSRRDRYRRPVRDRFEDDDD